jgi:hypothetical protein
MPLKLKVYDTELLDAVVPSGKVHLMWCAFCEVLVKVTNSPMVGFLFETLKLATGSVSAFLHPNGMMKTVINRRNKALFIIIVL